jgi:hypothetical protein
VPFEHNINRRRASVRRRICRQTLSLALAILFSGCMVPGFPFVGAHTPVDAPVFYPDLPEQPRIQYLATYSTLSDVTGGPSFFERLVMGDSKDPEIAKPYGMTTHDGKIFVCDSKRGAVVILDLLARSVTLLGDRKPGMLQKPINIAIDDDGVRYITDIGRGRVMVYDRHPRGPGLRHGRAERPRRSAGQAERRGDRPRRAKGCWRGGALLSHQPRNRLGRRSLRVRHGELPDREVRSRRPRASGVRRTRAQHRAAGSAFENVQIFDPDGLLLLFFGSPGNMPGGVNLPAQVEIDYEHAGLFADRVAPGHAIEYLVLVSSQFGLNKVNVYGFLRRLANDDGMDASVPGSEGSRTPSSR